MTPAGALQDYLSASHAAQARTKTLPALAHALPGECSLKEEAACSGMCAAAVTTECFRMCLSSCVPSLSAAAQPPHTPRCLGQPCVYAAWPGWPSASRAPAMAATPPSPTRPRQASEAHKCMAVSQPTPAHSPHMLINPCLLTCCRLPGVVDHNPRRPAHLYLRPGSGAQLRQPLAVRQVRADIVWHHVPLRLC